MMIFMKLNSSEIFVSRVQNTVRLKSSHPMWFTSRLACWRFSFLKKLFDSRWSQSQSYHVTKMFYFQFYLNDWGQT